MAGSFLSVAAEAAPLLSPVTVTAHVPGGFDDDPATGFTLSDSVDPAVGIAPDDGSNIGDGLMLEAEFIEFVDASIHVRIAAGTVNGEGQGITGLFGDGMEEARYVFDGLAFAGKVITGYTVYGFDNFETSGTTGLISTQNAADFVSWDGNDAVTLLLEDLIFAARGAGESGDYADFRIDLLTRDTDVDPPTVPEPASLALALSALLVMAWTRRRSSQRR
ncbi:MAG: PEP-CTERM sorting domain-containing protein [Candidatus Nanopelagicales bacterium]|nr:PEP-CTERM sorting domain-containing protein [Candidatus Nanopelagicales bacterium]